MKLNIVSAHDHSVHQIVWLELQTPIGSFVIQTGHAPMILSLSPQQSITFRLKSGKQQSISILYGIAHITRTDATLIITPLPS